MNRPSPAYPLFVTNDCDKLSTDSGKLSTDHESSEIISVHCGSDDSSLDINTRVSSSPLFLPQSKPSPYPKYTLIPTLLNDETKHPQQLPNIKRKRHSTTFLPNKLAKRSPSNNEHRNMSFLSSLSENHASEKSNQSCISSRNIVNNKRDTTSSSPTRLNYQSTPMLTSSSQLSLSLSPDQVGEIDQVYEPFLDTIFQFIHDFARESDKQICIKSVYECPLKISRQGGERCTVPHNEIRMMRILHNLLGMCNYKSATETWSMVE